MKTSDIPNAGTHANVTLDVYGEKGKAESKPLVSDDGDRFDRGKQAEFDVRRSMVLAEIVTL